MSNTESATLVVDLLRYADLIEDELVANHRRGVGDASDCASPVMRDAARYLGTADTLLAASRAEVERLRQEVSDMRHLLDTRPAKNAGLAESYDDWSSKVYIFEAHAAMNRRAALSTNPTKG